MIIGVGTDIFLMSRISDEAIQEGDAFFKRAYTEKEHQEASKRSDKKIYYASRFCVKEAVYKAISVCNREFHPGEIEILTDEMGRPRAYLHGKTKETLEKITPNYTLHVSLSYDTEYATSFAIAEETNIKENTI